MDQRRRDTLVLAGLAAGAALALGAVKLRRRYEFAGNVVLITGGSRGLGLVLARQLAAQGARLAICARDPEELRRAEADLVFAGADVLSLPCDVTAREQVEDTVAAVLDYFGRIDVLINNAGVIQVGPLDVMTVDDFQEAMAVHFWAPLYMTLAVLPGMRERGQGRIVNISSIGGKIALPHLAPYCASKFALVGLSEGLRTELLAEGIKVTTVCPGLMRTGSPRNATFKGKHRAEYAWFAISDAVPVASMDVRRAARQIIEACRRGDAELIVGLPAKLAITFHDLLPGVTAGLAALVDRLLPGPGGIGTRRAYGFESESWAAPSLVTALNERAAQRNNEVFEPI